MPPLDAVPLGTPAEAAPDHQDAAALTKTEHPRDEKGHHRRRPGDRGFGGAVACGGALRGGARIAAARGRSSSSKAKGMAQAAALQKKASEPPKARPPAPNESGWWRMEDLSKAFKKYSEDPSAPEANYFMGKALQMAGQADQADEQYSLFYDRCVAIHQNRDKALKFYEQKIHILKKKQAKTLLRGAEPSVEDAKKLEEDEMMAAWCMQGSLVSMGGGAKGCSRTKVTINPRVVFLTRRKSCVREVGAAAFPAACACRLVSRTRAPQIHLAFWGSPQAIDHASGINSQLHLARALRE